MDIENWTAEKLAAVTIPLALVLILSGASMKGCQQSMDSRSVCEAGIATGNPELIPKGCLE